MAMAAALSTIGTPTNGAMRPARKNPGRPSPRAKQNPGGKVDAARRPVRAGRLDVSAKEAAAYHSRHDVEVAVARRPLRGRRAEDVLKRFVERGRFGYVVMGGFGRPPVVESLLRSVTCAMIAASRVPLFLAR